MVVRNIIEFANAAALVLERERGIQALAKEAALNTSTNENGLRFALGQRGVSGEHIDEFLAAYRVAKA
jgi:hypothetical protein